MKNIKQLKEEIKQNGLIGTAADIELYQRLLIEVKANFKEIIQKTVESDIDESEMATRFAQIIEVFAYSEGNFDRADFAEDLKFFLYGFTENCDTQYGSWLAQMFGSGVMV